VNWDISSASKLPKSFPKVPRIPTGIFIYYFPTKQRDEGSEINDGFV
jgi:hypothetical protein